MILNSISSVQKKYERWIPIIFFILGFVFDTFMLRRIDELKTIIQQALYILVSAILIAIEMREEKSEMQPPRFLKKIWKYREQVLHFLLGTLLNSYTIFYFKSASSITSFVFIVLLVVLLMLNEFKHFGESQTKVHICFLGLCLISYLVTLVPITLGFIGHLTFLLANLIAILGIWIYHKALGKYVDDSPLFLRKQILLPFFSIQLVFAGLYFTHAIPPAPISAEYMGIFHEIKKAEGDYQLSYTRSLKRFWEHGDQSFLARSGDIIYCFARVFSPARFKEHLHFRWLYHDEKLGWTSMDVIDIPTVGGREEGYRAITKKSNYQPGDWRVQIETVDNREIGRISFTVTPDDTVTPREVTTITE